MSLSKMYAIPKGQWLQLTLEAGNNYVSVQAVQSDRGIYAAVATSQPVNLDVCNIAHGLGGLTFPLMASGQHVFVRCLVDKDCVVAARGAQA